jgi:hypothetical protein
VQQTEPEKILLSLGLYTSISMCSICKTRPVLTTNASSGRKLGRLTALGRPTLKVLPTAQGFRIYQAGVWFKFQESQSSSSFGVAYLVDGHHSILEEEEVQVTRNPQEASRTLVGISRAGKAVHWLRSKQMHDVNEREIEDTRCKYVLTSCIVLEGTAVSEVHSMHAMFYGQICVKSHIHHGFIFLRLETLSSREWSWALELFL